MFTFGSVIAAFASEGPNGNKRKGKYTYRKVFKACMARGEAKTATPTVSPSNKKQLEWKQIFESKNFSEFGCEQEWDKLADKDILDIYSYFYHSAADSPTPSTCK